MKIAVTNIYTKNIKELAIITTEYNKRKYCEKHGYDLIVQTDNFALPHLGFEKLNLIKNTIQTNKYDWVYWCGTDTMITNYKIKLEDIIDENYCFIIAPDLWDWNVDSMLFKNDERTIRFLETIISRYSDHIDENGNPKINKVKRKDGNWVAWAENGAIIEECKGIDFTTTIKKEYQNFVKEVPQKTMNSYLYNLYATPEHSKKLDYQNRNGQWSKGDFLVHWPGAHNNLKLQLALATVQQVQE